MITVRLEPLPPFDERGHPEFWLVVNSRNEETRRYGGRDKAVAEAYVTEFNITAYEADRRMRDAGAERAAKAASRTRPTGR